MLLVAHVIDSQWGTQACWACDSFFPLCCTARNSLLHSIQTVVCSIYTAWQLQNNILIMLILIIAFAFCFVFNFPFKSVLVSTSWRPPLFFWFCKRCACICICPGACNTMQGREGEAEVCRLPPRLCISGRDLSRMSLTWVKNGFKSCHQCVHPPPPSLSFSAHLLPSAVTQYCERYWILLCVFLFFSFFICQFFFVPFLIMKVKVNLIYLAKALGCLCCKRGIFNCLFLIWWINLEVIIMNWFGTLPPCTSGVIFF